MKATAILLVGLLSAAMPLMVWGGPPLLPPPPPRMPAPLLFIRLYGPPTMRATFYEMGREVQTLPAPVAVGLRPGYIYRFKLTGVVPDHPEMAFYPSLEVRGTVAPAHGLNPAAYPVPIVITPLDMERVNSGAFLAKVAYLEDPEQAVPEATRPDLPIEIEVPPTRDPVEEARARGRLVLLARFGERDPDPEDMVRNSIPGTMLLPDAIVLGPPLAPPYVPWSCFPVFDPFLGPKPPVEECLRDGGDMGIPAGLDAAGHVRGLDPADTAAEYTDSKGQRRLAISNKVCLFAPRFAFIRTERLPIGYNAYIGVAREKVVLAKVTIQERNLPVEKHLAEELEIMVGRGKTSGTQSTQGLLIAEQVQGPVVIVGRVKGAEVVGSCVSEKPDKPLLLCKWADKTAVNVGDVVTFHLRFTNTGGQPITDVAVSDSLTGRLEYIPGSSQADREVALSLKPNEAGSLILRWEVGGTLLPGQSGYIAFKARVR